MDDKHIAVQHEGSPAISENVDAAARPGGKSLDIANRLVDIYDAGNVTPELDRKCLRRIDMVLMPIMFMTYALQYMDRACLTGAALFGITEDLNLLQFDRSDGLVLPNLQRYSYCTLIFYWGYLLGLLPGTWLSQRFPLGRYVSVLLFVWGGVAVCTVAVESYPGLMVQRFFLGFVEAGVAPAFSLITAMWYKRQEQPLRYAIWYSSIGLATLVGILILYGIGHLQGALASWRYMFMIVGSFTSVWGICVWFTLPDSPVTARFLSHELKVIAVERMRFEQIGIENKTFKREQVKEAFADPKTWFYVLTVFCMNITNGGVTGFGSIIVQSFGYSNLKSILLLGGAGAMVFVFLLVAGTISVYVRNARTWCAMFACLPVIAGAAMMWKSDWDNRAVPLWGFYFTAVYSTTMIMVLALMGANTAGHTKKAVTAGMVWASYCCSNGVAPLLVKTQQTAEHYPDAFIPVISLMSFVFVALLGFRFYVLNLNKKREAEHHYDRTDAATKGFLDLTDRQNPAFRYSA